MNGEQVGFYLPVKYTSHMIELHESSRNMLNCFLLWDQNDQLIFCNKELFELFPGTHDLYVIGRTFEETLRIGLKSGFFKTSRKMTTKQWIDEQLEMHRKEDSVQIQEVKDRWFYIKSYRTEDGCTAIAVIDVTYLQQPVAEFVSGGSS